MQFGPTSKQMRQERAGVPAPYPGQGSKPHEQSAGSGMQRYPPQLQLFPKSFPQQASKRLSPRTQTQAQWNPPDKRLNQLPISLPNHHAKLPQPPVEPDEYGMLDSTMGIDNKNNQNNRSRQPPQQNVYRMNSLDQNDRNRPPQQPNPRSGIALNKKTKHGTGPPPNNQRSTRPTIYHDDPLTNHNVCG